MKAFVTGGSGQIGYYLIRALLKKGYQVRCLLHKNLENYKDLDVELVAGDLLSIESMYSHMKDVDVVFHLAAKISLDTKDNDLMERINVHGTKAVAIAAKKANVSRFIYFSSIHVLSNIPYDKPITEDRSLIFESKAYSYSLSKLKAHKLVLDLTNQGLNTSIILPTGVISPHPNHGSMNKILKKIANKKFSIFFNGGFNWVDARDVAKAAIACVEKGKKGQQYIIAGHYRTFKQIVSTIKEEKGRKKYSISLPLWLGYLLLPLFFSSLINKKTLDILRYSNKHTLDNLSRIQLNHSPRAFRKTIQDIIE